MEVLLTQISPILPTIESNNVTVMANLNHNMELERENHGKQIIPTASKSQLGIQRQYGDSTINKHGLDDAARDGSHQSAECTSLSLQSTPDRAYLNRD
jgi:hypothetical protein